MWLHPDPWARALRGVLEARLAERRNFEDNVRSTITAVAPSGTFVETVPVRAVIAGT